ncbi:TPA: transposase family protein [Escherichia coli]|nr:transposase family protein [Escherichia coli]EHK7384910.1 transposase family protein [Escherichia coli]EHK7520229.1 transposase family protein [Escherichia coli]EHT4078098.1 transposase family protein [Escherichia coli]HAX4635694.1 transposase family protein [Escherichia coli]
MFLVIFDFRQAWKVVCKLSYILLLIMCNVIYGTVDWEYVNDFCETHLEFVK